ncbi:hypothetical protein Daus18300_001702 [Diaporthe australafricana]|uniref:F-box domain-containing protein n=1 Tax=Diaporthe australafricana TaxID=127596 RepID=A0ABR3XV19_9PEZI
MEQDSTINEAPGDSIVMEHPITHGLAFPSMRAARHFSDVTELLVIMGPYVSARDLASLCRVNGRFNTIFTQALYKHVRLNYGFLQAGNLARSPADHRFMNTMIMTSEKSTEFFGSDMPAYGRTYGGQKATEWACDLVQKAATGILRNAPNVHTINLDSAFIGGNRAILVVNNGLDDKSKLSSHCLQSLTLSLGAFPCRELSTSIFQEQCLQLLCLTKIPTGTWSKDTLCQILKASPSLKYLELSYSKASEHQWGLQSICEKYEKLGGQPLALDVLILGKGVVLKLPTQNPSSNEDVDVQASYLALLANPTRLKEISIVAAQGLAWDTFDPSFLPEVTDFHLIASMNSGGGAWVKTFFSKAGARSFLAQVHLHVEGDVFDYPHFRGMAQQLFAPRIENDLTSILAPLGFTYLRRLPMEDKNEVTRSMPLPSTQCLDILINYQNLVNFATRGLFKMSALRSLRLNISTCFFNGATDRAAVCTKQMEALEKAASRCPDLRYVRMEMETDPFLPSVAGLSRSWSITREREPGSSSRKLVAKFHLLGADADWVLRPKSMRTIEDKKAQYVKDTRVALTYLGGPRG